MRIAVPVAATAIVLAGVGVAIAAGSDPSPDVVGLGEHSGDPASYATGTRAAGAAVTADQAVRQVLTGLGTESLVNGLTSVPGKDGRSVLAVALARNNDEVADVWRADLAIGAFAELTHAEAQKTFSDFASGGTAIGPNDKGIPTTSQLGVGAVRFGQAFVSPSDADLTKQIHEGAAKFGLEVKDVTILHPLESAVDVTLVVPAAGSVDWSIDQLRAALIGVSPVVEGALITLVDPDGTPLLKAGAAYRTGEGGLWFAPGEDGRFGALHGGAPWEKK
jgi:hypothetical protein